MKYLNSLFPEGKELKLDLGSGLCPKPNYIGIDSFIGICSQTIEPENIDFGALNVIKHDLSEGIPFSDNSISEIVTSHCLEHCSNLDYLFREVFRVLKTQSIFEITVPYANSAEGLYPGHNIFFTEKWFLRNITFNSLFDIKDIKYFASDYYINYKRIINKSFNFHEARLFLFNVCNQMQIISSKRIKSIENDIDIKVIMENNNDLLHLNNSNRATKLWNKYIKRVYRSSIVTKIRDKYHKRA